MIPNSKIIQTKLFKSLQLGRYNYNEDDKLFRFDILEKVFCKIFSRKCMQLTWDGHWKMKNLVKFLE